MMMTQTGMVQREDNSGFPSYLRGLFHKLELQLKVTFTLGYSKPSTEVPYSKDKFVHVDAGRIYNSRIAEGHPQFAPERFHLTGLFKKPWLVAFSYIH